VPSCIKMMRLRNSQQTRKLLVLHGSRRKFMVSITCHWLPFSGKDYRYLMTRLNLQVFYLWRHVSSTAPPLILWWSNLEILVAPLHRSSPFIGELRCQAIQMEHGPYITEKTQKAVYNVRCLLEGVVEDTEFTLVDAVQVYSTCYSPSMYRCISVYQRPLTAGKACRKGGWGTLTRNLPALGCGRRSSTFLG
jgi:hypothetical protein